MSIRDSDEHAIRDRLDRRVRACVIAMLAIALALHALQIVSPLRLNTDAVLFLRMAEASDEGRGFKPPDVQAPFPTGYPAVLVALRVLGLDHAAGLIGVNVIALVIGIGATWAVIAQFSARAPPGTAGPGARQPGIAPPFVCLLTVMSWLFIKHTPLPISELLYVALSLLALVVISAGGWARRFLLGGALIAACVMLRTIGLALVPALLWAGAMMWAEHRRASARPRITRAAWPLGVLGAAAIVAIALFAVRTRYWTDMLGLYGTQPITDAAARTVAFRLADMGQCMLNTNVTVLGEASRPPLMLAGAIGYALLFAGLWRQRRAPHPAIVYLAVSSAFVLIWPYRDPRFLLPMIPLMLWTMGVSALALPRVVPARMLLLVWAAAWLTLGTAAMAYSTSLTFSGSAFPDRFGADEFRESYRAAYNQPLDPAAVNPHVLRMLRRHDPARAQPAPAPAR